MLTKTRIIPSSASLSSLPSIDPTKTSNLRNLFASKVKARFNLATKEILETFKRISLMDDFQYQGIRATRNTFLKRLRDYVIDVTNWWDEELYKAFNSGARRLWADVNGNSARTRSAEVYGEFLKIFKRNDRVRDSYNLLSNLMLETLDDSIDNVAKKLARLTYMTRKDKWPRSQSLSEAKSIIDQGRNNLNLIARAEIVRAYADGQLESAIILRVSRVRIRTELNTTKDTGTISCKKCLKEAKGKVYNPEYAKGLIPIHPGCRCAFIPVTRKLNKTTSKKKVES